MSTTDHTPTSVTTTASPPAPGYHSLQLSENARTVLARRYLDRDDAGRPTERPEDLFLRVARALAHVDTTYLPDADAEARTIEFYNVMADLEFLPNSPTLMNAGRALGQLAACFVLPVEDSLEAIFEAVKDAALIHQSGGGTGFAFSRLRPARDIVRSTHGISSGPVSFMRVFDTATETIKQGGTRRGANMGILRVDHPDILDFIRAKHEQTMFTNFNISVAATAAFMEAVRRDEAYALVNPRTGMEVERLRARDVFNEIVTEAWRYGDPGLVFLDRINADNPTPELGEIESTNPCGEQPLLPYEACNLGSVNVGRMTVRRNGVTEIDYPRLARVVRTAVRFLDNVVEANEYPLPQIEAMTKGNRKIGLGVMGFADLLIRLGVSYDSEGGLAVAEELMAFVQRRADEVSLELGRERGVFPNWSRSVYAKDGLRYRNATRTTVAPTGTISIIAGASSGIEPLFGLAFVRRNVLEGTTMTDVNPTFIAVARAHGFYSETLMEAVAEHGSLEGVDGIPDDVRRLFRTAHQIPPEWHVRMQAAFQVHTDNAVSKTVNLPYEATPDDVRTVYLLAYELGCKGVTIYRDRSRESQVLGFVGPPAAEAGPTEGRPQVLHGDTYKIASDQGDIYVTVNRAEEGIPVEVLVQPATAAGAEAASMHALGRLATLALQTGAPVEEVIAELEGHQAPAAVHSAASALAHVLRHYAETGSPAQAEQTGCPQCGAPLEIMPHCWTCQECGYSRCF